MASRRQKAGRMRVLILASKCPWPPMDGGRLALWQTILALHATGVTMRLVVPISGAERASAPSWQTDMAPIVQADLLPSGARPWPLASAEALWSGTAVSLARHAHRPLASALPEIIQSWQPDVIHAECLQSLAMLGPSPWPRPVVLRLQNVESDLWQQWPTSPLLRPLMRAEAARLRHDEQRLLRLAGLNLAITDFDATRLRELCPSVQGHRVRTWTVPFPAELPAAPASPGKPQVVLPGSRGWGPNQQAFDWALRELAPALWQRSPALRLTVFTPSRDPLWPQNIDVLPVPVDSQSLFPGNAIAALPLFAGSGIRMRILEAWARGLPVVATSIAARGLTVQSGRELLIADQAEDFAAALSRLSEDADLCQRLVAAGRHYLRQHHDPVQLGQELLGHYQRVLAEHP